MNDLELDGLLSVPLPERDAGEFSVTLMEHIAHEQARPARILSWVMVGVLAVLVAAACSLGAIAAGQPSLGVPIIGIAAALTFLTLLLSFAVMQSARE